MDVRQFGQSIIPPLSLPACDLSGIPVPNDLAASRIRKRPGRRPGRPPSGGQAVDQRERLLGIALDLLASDGIGKTTLSAIARQAGLTPAMVHYYFKTREQLFDELFEQRILPMRRSIDGIFEDHASDPIRAFSELAERFVQISRDNPWFGPVWLRDLIGEHDTFRQHIKKRVNEERQKVILTRVRQWQAQGLINPALEPALLFVSLISLTALPMTALRQWHDDPLRRHIEADDILRHAQTLFVHGLKPVAS